MTTEAAITAQLRQLKGQRVHVDYDGTTGLVVSVYAPNADPDDVQVLVRPDKPKSYPRRYYATSCTVIA